MNERQQILIVEDDDQIRETLLTHLADDAYIVTGASNGNEAIPLLYGREYQCVVLDLNMPYIDGFGVLKFIRSTFPATRVIVITANRDLRTMERCKEFGVEEVLWKPFDVEQLIRTVDQLLRPARPDSQAGS
jgi:CheY-like chemotaxis protein